MIKSLLSNYWGSVGRGMFVCCMYEYYNVFFRIFKVYMCTGLPLSMYTMKSPIDMRRFNVSQLKEFLAFSVKDRCQINYFICIKDFNAETNTSLKLNLFSFFICDCQH
jgi:hypothetical protein